MRPDPFPQDLYVYLGPDGWEISPKRITIGRREILAQHGAEFCLVCGRPRWEPGVCDPCATWAHVVQNTLATERGLDPKAGAELRF